MAQGKREGLADASSKVDRISVLPSEVLELILSFLTLKEAAATSILSSSWRYSWLSSTKLDFDGTPSLKKVRSPALVLDQERSKFVRWVDRVLITSQSLNQRSNLEEFRVAFDLTISHSEWIDDWLSYALGRKVQRLHLILLDVNGSKYSHKCYKFPYKKGNFPSNFKLLKELSMHLVSVSGKAVEFFLASCLLLERLSVSGSRLISSLEIVGTFPAFKCLELSRCHKLESVLLRDSSLVTLKYSGDRVIKFVLVNVPLLTQLWVYVVCSRIKDAVGMFSSVLPQLEMLKIYSTYPISWKDSREFTSTIEMFNLKQLVVRIGVNNISLLPVINLIYASPRLQRFVVEATQEYSKSNDDSDDSDEDYWLYDGPMEIPKENSRAYFNLKEVEFVGYVGKVEQLELIRHFVEKNVALTKITIDPQCFKLMGSHLPWDHISFHRTEDEISAYRTIAKKQLQKHVPSRINLEIL